MDLSPGPTRILVVDDELLIADTLKVILTRAGFEVSVAYNGIEALGQARAFRPDIVVADFSMPGTNGLDTCVSIKQVLPGCRVIMLSAHSLWDDIASYRSKGYNFMLLSKPIYPTELISAVRSQAVQTVQTERRIRVLNVDDVEEHRYSMSRLLTQAGFDLSEAATGEQALQMARSLKPDLILLDIHLPDRDGFAVCAALKADPETARITVVHVTSSAKSAESETKSRQVGADGYIPFPVVPSAFITRARELLQLQFLKEQLN